MAQFAKPFSKKARGLWYVEISRKQINVGPDREAAFRQHDDLMSPPAVSGLPTESLIPIIDNFLESVHRYQAPTEWYR